MDDKTKLRTKLIIGGIQLIIVLLMIAGVITLKSGNITEFGKFMFHLLSTIGAIISIVLCVVVQKLR